MENVTVYFDYLCPFTYRAMELAEGVAGPLELSFNWDHYSLYQGNYKGDDWRLWDDALVFDAKDGGKGLLPFLASCAVKEQGEEVFNSFRLALMRAHHVDEKPFTKEVVFEVADEAGADVGGLERILDNQETREALAQDHQRAASKGVAASPTFKFSDGNLAYFRFDALPKDVEEAVNFFQDYRKMLSYPYLQTIRRPYETLKDEQAKA